MKKLIHCLIAAATVVAAVAMFTPSIHVKAFNPQPDPPAFGMVSIDISETARLNAVCSAGPLPEGATAGPCMVTLAFRDLAGRVLTQNTVNLQPGQGTSLDLRGMDLVRGGGRRMEIGPYISPVGRGYVLVTTEVFEEANGHTSLVENPTEPASLTSATAGQ